MKYIKIKPVWTVTEDSYSKDRVSHNGTKFTIANGYMGYRGTLSSHRKQDYAGCTLAGIYDQYEDQWREPVNAPNSLFMDVSFNGEELNLDKNQEQHQQALNVYESSFQRESRFTTSHGAVTVYSERFVSADDVHLIAEQTIMSTDADGELVIKAGLDLDIWDLNGPHFKTIELEKTNGRLLFTGTTNEDDKVSVCEFLHGLPEAVNEENGIREYRVSVKAGESLRFNRFAHIYTSKDCPSPEQYAFECSKDVHSYGEVFSAHTGRWAERWQQHDVVIDGDERGLLALRYSIYQLLAAAPTHTDKIAIPARGLSAQVYKGAMFWDTEMHMSPMFNLTNPDIAKNLLMYRYRGLSAAKVKASEFDLKGAYYPWEAQETGEEMCTLFNLTDVFSGRKVRTYFMDKQIHVNSAIVYAFWDFYNTTGDEDFLLNEGAEVFVECARLFCSWAYFKPEKDRFELLDVVGPDEYHERVHNNYYTNRMAKDSMEKTLKVLDMLKTKSTYSALAEKLGLTEAEVETFRAFNEKLYVAEPNCQGVIEQCDDYFKLEDISIADLKQRVLNPNEHWGGAWGIAADTQILKQADTVLPLYLLNDQYSQDVKKATWEYYEPRTEHGSSLSPCIYSLVACDIGKIEWAYDYFLKTAEIDINFGTTKQFAGTLFKGGTHPAANGGAYMSVVHGFAGLRAKDDHLAVNPQLPDHWNGLSFKVNYRGEPLQVEISGKAISIQKLSDSDSVLRLRIGGEDYLLNNNKLEVLQ